MNPSLSRRSLLLSGAAAALLPWDEVAAAAVADAAKEVFGFGVASGDPTASAVVLWTRVTPSPEALPGSGKGKPVTVVWELAADEAFTSVVRSGKTVATAARDHTVHVDVTGLPTYTRFFYRFRALNQTSAVGRTQTAPDEAGRTHALRFAFASCANWTGGFFSAYRHLAARDDLDFVLFLGDYLYEYGNTDDRYGPPELAGKRDHEPAGEMRVLRDYRQRHALYKTDPDLQAAHRRHPWIFTFDDHEVCDNTWKGGAVNHQPATEGSFASRKRQAYQAYLEWVPLRLPDQTGAAGTRFWRRFAFGDLADLSVLETRQNRSEQLAIGDERRVGDPSRHLPEPAQMAWLTGGLRAKRTWHLIGNQVVLSQLRVPGTPSVVGMLTDLLPGLSSPVPTGGYVFNTDQWDGYGADQAHLLAAMAAAKTGDAVVFTGDIHSSWANDLPLDAGSYVPGVAGVSAGTEFVCPSVTSDGFYEIANRQSAGALALADAIKAGNRNVRYLEGIGHGFCVADVTPERVRVDFVHLTSTTHADDPRLDPKAGARIAASWQSVRGARAVSLASGAMGARSDAPRTLPVRRRTVRPDSAGPVMPTGNQLASTGGRELLAGAGAAALVGLAAVRARLR